ncbi:MAG: polyphosphate polymerase domain-containing protein [Firmicutes bacterium]|nr:polyphosphate polymerase domain-containing protein [Bacillota bacterium]
MDSKVYRHEMKFLCGESQLYIIENKIRHICRPDFYGGDNGSYRVKSLYFDTPDDMCWQEILSGTDARKKYRLRIYNDDADVIKLECKYSLRDRKAKEVCRMTRKQCLSLMVNSPAGRVEPAENADPLLCRFLVERRMELLTPKVIVEYRRTPYVFPGGNVRITFDRRIRSSCRTERFLEKGDALFKSILPENVHILEVKYDEGLPGAVRELLTAGQELRRTSFSKYGLCREYGME